MKKGWETRRLGEVLRKTETVNPLQSPNTEFEYIDVSSVSNKTFRIESTQRLRGRDAPSRARRLVRANDILFATVRPTLQRIAIVPDELDGQVCSTGYFVLRPKSELDAKFLFHSLFTAGFCQQMEKLQRGASYPAVTDGDVRSQQISFPPLPEQRRIVGILDEAFDGIATAKANAEKNLQNARAVFESHLNAVFMERGEAWIHTTVGEQILLQRGFDITKSQQNAGTVPVVSSGGIKSFHDQAMASSPGVVIGRKGTLGKVFYLDDDYWPHDTTLWVKDFKGNNARFVYYFFKMLDVLRLDSGAANPALNRNQVHPIEVYWPPVSEQPAIVSILDALVEDSERLASIYQRKLAGLDQLKKSLLHQAFSGEL
jgi:type I restriction enzyme, S subunit